MFRAHHQPKQKKKCFVFFFHPIRKRRSGKRGRISVCWNLFLEIPWLWKAKSPFEIKKKKKKIDNIWKKSAPRKDRKRARMRVSSLKRILPTGERGFYIYSKKIKKITGGKGDTYIGGGEGSLQREGGERSSGSVSFFHQKKKKTPCYYRYYLESWQYQRELIFKGGEKHTQKKKKKRKKKCPSMYSKGGPVFFTFGHLKKKKK